VGLPRILHTHRALYSKECLIISWSLWRKTHFQDTNLLHENRCRPCVLSRSTARDESLNHCPIDLLSTSPLTNRTHEICVRFTWTNISKSPIIARTHLPFFWLLTRLPHISSPNSQWFSSVRDCIFHISDHKWRGNNYRQHNIINNRHYLTWRKIRRRNLDINPLDTVFHHGTTWPGAWPHWNIQD
jgi:hypothetical protein